MLIEILIGSEWVCLFGHGQSGVDAALCRAHSKTPSFFGRLGKLHGVPALAGRDRLKAGLHTKGPWLPAKQKRHLCCSEFLRTEQGGVCRAATDRCSNGGLHAKA